MTTTRLPATALARFGAYLQIFLGVGLIAYGGSLLNETPMGPLPLIVALLLCGGLEIVLAWLVTRVRRAAWAFSISLNGTACIVFLFGAPKVRDAFGLELWVSMLPCLAFMCATMLHILGSEDFGT